MFAELETCALCGHARIDHRDGRGHCLADVRGIDDELRRCRCGSYRAEQ